MISRFIRRISHVAEEEKQRKGSKGGEILEDWESEERKRNDSLPESEPPPAAPITAVPLASAS